MQKNVSGFGLLEIVITIAIIAVLATAAAKFYTSSTGGTVAETIQTGENALDAAHTVQKSSDAAAKAQQKQYDAVK